MDSSHNTPSCLTVKAYNNGKEKTFELTGQKARMMAALIQAGKDGVTALDISNTWAYRTSAYVHDLRHDYGMDIQMIREDHKGGWHGRYILHSSVEIISVD